jgi:hypothetical protein
MTGAFDYWLQDRYSCIIVIHIQLNPVLSSIDICASYQSNFVQVWNIIIVGS